MSRHLTFARTSAVLLSAGLVLAAAPATGALAATSSAPSVRQSVSCSTNVLSGMKRAVNGAAARRAATLSSLTIKLATRPHLTADHRATLTALYSADGAGISGVNRQVQSDGTCDAVESDAQAIVTDYRVYALLVPQSGLTLAADAGTFGANSLAATEPALRLAIKVMPAGSTKDQAQSLYVSMAGSVKPARSGEGRIASTMPAAIRATGMRIASCLAASSSARISSALRGAARSSSAAWNNSARFSAVSEALAATPATLGALCASGSANWAGWNTMPR